MDFNIKQENHVSTVPIAWERELMVARDRFEAFSQILRKNREMAEGMTIKNNDDYAQAVALGGSFQKLKKETSNLKLEITKDARDFAGRVNSLANRITEECDRATKQLKAKGTNWLFVKEQERREKEKKLQEEHQRLQEQLNLAAKEANTTPIEIAPPVLPDEDDGIKTETGTSYTKKQWVFELEDLMKVPIEYLMLNEKKVKDNIKAGVRNIFGIKIFEEKKLVIRSK